ncbi:MAG TPA: MFS transporter [Myxococcota bacterium]|jgi:predicted MFS family arabinose efflux permease
MLLGLLLAVSLRAAHDLVGAGILPSLVRDLGGEALAGAFFSAFSFAAALGILAGGAAADRFGPARTFAAGLAGFAAGMLGTGFAPHMHAVIAARAVEGFFAGMFSCVVSAVVMRAYDDAARPRVLALLSAAWVVPGLLAPAGAVSAAAAFGWRAVFLGLVPLVGLAALLALPRLLRLGAGERTAQAAGPLSLLGDRELRAALATRALVVVAFFGVEAFMPLALERVLGATRLQQASLLTASALCWTAGAFWQARWNARWGPLAFARLGGGLLVGGIALAVSSLAGAVSIEVALAAWAFAGLGMGIAYQTATAAAMRTSRMGSEGATGAALGVTDALAIAVSTGVCGAFLEREPLALGVAPTALLAGFALALACGLASVWTATRLRPPALAVASA